MTTYDAIIIGAGHNGLVTAAYLARAGRRVLVLERRDLVGGACVTEEVFPGYQVSVAAYVVSLFRPEIIRDLQLHEHGLELLPRDPSSFTPFLDGRSLLMGPDAAATAAEVARFSPRDAETLPRFEAWLDAIVARLEPTLLNPVPTPPRHDDIDPLELAELLAGSVRDLLDRWFESEELKVTLATDGLIGVFGSPSSPGTAYNFLHHVSGRIAGSRGAWVYVRGGTGRLSQALADAARAHGAEIRTNARVGRILVEGDRAVGVALDNGTEFRAAQVASNATAEVTFRQLLEPSALPGAVVTALDRIDYRSASMKINVALSELPNFRCREGVPAPHHRGTTHICESFAYLDAAYHDALAGRPSMRPMIECGFPSAVDPTVAPPGKHLMSLFVQYAPYHLAEGDWASERDRFADRVLDVLTEYAPNLRGAVINRLVLAPPDIEARFGLTGGHIFQGAMTAGSIWHRRPVAGWGGVATTLVPGLYLCGSAAHPGGAVSGLPGWLAARVMLQDERGNA
jgi:phytoene dehydrogenase-like protein